MTQSKLKELYSYDPTTGHFTRRTSRGNVKAGTVAGCVTQEGYVTIRYLKKNLRAHRLAFLYMTGKMPSKEMDHINHIKDDNRWSNLREVTATLNSRNKKLSVANKSGYAGVSYRSSHKKWQARIVVNYKPIFLGYFRTKEEAIVARKEAEKKHGFL